MDDILFRKMIVDGLPVLVPASEGDMGEIMRSEDGAFFVAKRQKRTRTTTQNAAMHVFFRNLAQALNDAGFDMKVFLKSTSSTMPIAWNPVTVKEVLWRPVQEAMTGKHSTTEVNTVEPSDIHQQLMRKISELTGVYVEFPNNRG